MTKQTSRAQLLNDIQVERRRLEQNLAVLTRKEMLKRRVVGEWSVKDVLAHLVEWEQHLIAWYAAGLRGEVPTLPAMNRQETDAFNQAIYEKHCRRTLDDILADFHTSYEEILATVQAIPEQDLFARGRYAWTGKWDLASYVAGCTCNHYCWAKTQIRKWMKAQGKL